MMAQQKRRVGGNVIQSYKDYEYDQKGHFPAKGE